MDRSPEPAGVPPGVVLPVRSFAGGKSRLAPRLDREQRRAIAVELATRVVAAAAPWPVTVVTSDPEVVSWAVGAGHGVLADPGSLDGAATAGIAHVLATGADRVVVAHADLALVTTLARLGEPGADPVAVVVPCRRLDGTPLLSLPASHASHFRPAYGPGSFARHVAEARRLGLGVVVPDDPALRHDVDDPDDLAAAEAVLGVRLAPGARVLP